jgi:DNA-binding response OmpR family regulator
MNAGYTITTASYDEAVEVIIEREPNLVIIFLPGCTASDLELCGSLLNVSNAPVIVIGSSKDPDCASKALEAGVDDYLTDLVSVRYIVARVRNILRRSMSRPLWRKLEPP